MTLPEGIARRKYDFSGWINLDISRTFMQKIVYYTERHTIIQIMSISNTFQLSKGKSSLLYEFLCKFLPFCDQFQAYILISWYKDIKDLKLLNI